jgi:hypothetical protein
MRQLVYCVADFNTRNVIFLSAFIRLAFHGKLRGDATLVFLDPHRSSRLREATLDDFARQFRQRRAG